MAGWRSLWSFGRREPPPAPPQVPPAPKPATAPSLPKGFPDWAELIRRSSAWTRRRPGRRGRVLIATNIGGHGPAAMMESTLAAALALRDADVEIVLCDAALPACLRAEYSDLPDDGVLTDRRLDRSFCPTCMQRGRAMFEPLGLRVHVLSELITPEERDRARRLAEDLPAAEIDGYEEEGLEVGEHARAGALRYYTRGDLEAEPNGETVLRRYLEASILSVAAYRRLLANSRFDVAVFHHGLYVPQGLVGEVCRKLGVRVVNWVVAYRNNSFILSHGDTYHRTLMDEPASDWTDMAWGERQRDDIAAYLKSRWQGGRDWIGFHEKPDEDAGAFVRAIGIDPKKPIIGMLSNVVWDAQLHYPANAFPSLTDWALRTIEYFGRRPDLQLVLRIHPAEVRGTARSRQPLLAEIEKLFPVLPGNVFIIPPESPVSTYAVMELCDSVLIYATKMGVELTAVGVPVVVAGEAWIKNKDLTLDAASPEEYFAILDRLPLGEPLPAAKIEAALKYAYHFFFRRMIPLGFLKKVSSNLFYAPDIASVDELTAGADPGLDVICDAILDGAPFIYPAEKLGVHDTRPSPLPAEG
jgi:hypothetical protein